SGPGTPEFDLFVAEVVREMTSKAGQKCTAIRRALVPAPMMDQVAEALTEALAKVQVGDPADEATTMGALASITQRDEVQRAISELSTVTRAVFDAADLGGVGTSRGAFLSPTLLMAAHPSAGAVHTTEAFGP